MWNKRKEKKRTFPELNKHRSFHIERIHWKPNNFNEIPPPFILILVKLQDFNNGEIVWKLASRMKARDLIKTRLKLPPKNSFNVLKVILSLGLYLQSSDQRKDIQVPSKCMNRSSTSLLNANQSHNGDAHGDDELSLPSVSEVGWLQISSFAGGMGMVQPCWKTDCIYSLSKRCPQKDICMNVHSTLIHNSQALETVQMSIDRRMDTHLTTKQF